jgi:hypothetical protein
LIAALYLTIWISLVLFAVGETSRHLSGFSTRWGWPLFVIGLVLCCVHIVIAFGAVHGWNHEAAVAATKTQTDAIYGLAWGGGVFVNYVFVGAWAMDAWWWRVTERRGRPMPATLGWPLRILYAVVLFNAAVIFAAGIRRALGLAIVVWLLWLWSRDRT